MSDPIPTSSAAHAAGPAPAVAGDATHVALPASPPPRAASSTAAAPVPSPKTATIARARDEVPAALQPPAPPIAVVAAPPPSPVLPAFHASASDVPWLVAGLVFVWWIGMSIGRALESLPHDGILARTASFARAALRLLAIALIAWLVAAIIPDAFAPTLPWMLLAAAAAVGWSARDLLPDALAGLVLRLERKLRPGTWITTEGASGVIETIGLRATIIASPNGARIAVPNRKLSTSTIALDQTRWPLIELELTFPESAELAAAEAAIHEAILLSPHLAPGPRAEILRASNGHPRAFVVRARLLEGRFKDAFTSALRARIEDRR